jgi:hypothetical protein
MVDQVWISEVMSNHSIFDMPGIRTKWFGKPWEVPYVHHAVPLSSDEQSAAMNRCAAGLPMKREDLPEASAVYSMAHFKRTKDVFFVRGFLAVKGRAADVLSKFNGGPGGGLVPYQIYEADEKTPLAGPFYLVVFSQKDCFLPDVSKNIKLLGVDQDTGQSVWTARNLNDGDIAVTPDATVGADFWICPGVKYRIFMRNRIVEALRTALSEPDFADFVLHRCKIANQ